MPEDWREHRDSEIVTTQSPLLQQISSVAPEDIEVLGAIDDHRVIPVGEILRALTGRQEKLVHGDVFTGRPGTRIFRSESVIVKIHENVRLAPEKSRAWVESALANERRYGVHHPSKTWILLKAGNRSWIGNACPVLEPLHQVIVGHDTARLASVFRDYFQIYIRIAQGFDKSLDAGLSNFGLDTSGRVFYLDDDIYNWDEFAGLSSTLGVWVRQYEGVSRALFQSIGSNLRRALEQYYGSSHWASVIAEQLRDLFTGNEAQEARLGSIIGALRSQESSAGAPMTGQRPASSAIEAEKLFTPESGRVAILADIHANLPALEAVLEHLERMSIRAGIVLGDSVGYGPHPGECIERLRSSGLLAIKGNHDHAAAVGLAGPGFSPVSKWVIDWTVPRLSQEDRCWLGALPLSLRGPDWLAVHGAPQDKTYFNAYVYRMTFEDNLQNLEDRDIRFCLHGHTHLAGVYYRKGRFDHHTKAPVFALQGANRSLICPGSVGQPRGNRAGAEFAIFDPEEGCFEFFCIDYDMERTIADMTREGFPAQLAGRLRAGK